MATTSKKSSLTTVALLFFVFGSAVIISSCTGQGEGKGEWIPTPPDTSALGKIDHFIPIEQMEAFKKQYDADRDSLMRCTGLSVPISEAFNKEWLLKVLKDTACVGIRIYYGIKGVAGKGGEMRMMIVGVDEQGRDLYITKGATLANQVGDGGKGGLEWGQCEPPCSNIP